METPWSSFVAASAGAGPGCELQSTGPLVEPVSAVSSLAFVVAAVVIAAGARRRSSRPGEATGRGAEPRLRGYALLVAGVGVGSAIQHGPDPSWSDVAHDLPLLATIAFLGADAVADLTGRPRVWWWWAGPTAALLPVVLAAPRAGDLAQGGVAALAVALTLTRARARPPLRSAIGWALGILAVGALIGTLSRAGGPLCDPAGLWQGHAVWHVLASVALVILAPVVGRRAAVRTSA